MLRLLMALACLVIMVACNNNSKRVFKPEAIPSETFAITTSKDTVLYTRNGAIIDIAAGSLQSTDSVVELEIKEAYHISEMLRAGLMTQSNGQPLSSGGMILIDAKGENTVKITKPIKVSIPSNYVDPNMQLFKGRPDENGNLNWVDPTSLPSTQATEPFAAGKTLFNGKCASCHTVDKDITGPALAHISKKRNKHYLFEFVRNNNALLAADECYCSLLAACVHKKWNRMPMNMFPELTDKDIQDIYDYIDNESSRLMIPFKPDSLDECANSCWEYNKTVSNLKAKKQELITDNGEQVKETRQFAPRTDSPIAKIDTSVLQNALDTLPRLVSPGNYEGIYYQFTIEAFGWYNIDLLMKNLEGTEETTLITRIIGQYKTRLNVYLVVPSIRLCAAGGKMDGKEDEYAFYTPDGKIPLPLGNKAYIIVMGDTEETILFASKEFTIDRSQQFDLTPASVTQEQFNLRMRYLNFDQLNIRVQDSKNSAEIRETMKALEQAEKLKPKNCDCDCGLDMLADTTAPRK